MEKSVSTQKNVVSQATPSFTSLCKSKKSRSIFHPLAYQSTANGFPYIRCLHQNSKQGIQKQEPGIRATVERSNRHPVGRRPRAACATGHPYRRRPLASHPREVMRGRWDTSYELTCSSRWRMYTVNSVSPTDTLPNWSRHEGIFALLSSRRFPMRTCLVVHHTPQHRGNCPPP